MNKLFNSIAFGRDRILMGSLIRRNSGVYYGVFTVRGKRVWRTTGARALDEATAVYRELSRQHDSWKRISILDFRAELLPLLEGKLAKSTIRLYGQALARLSEALGDLKLKTLTSYHIERFNSGRMKVVSAIKVRIDFRVLKAAFNRAVRYGMLENNPCLACEKPRVPEHTPRFLSGDEVDRLLAVVDNPQMRAIILIALCTAMRLGEIVNLRWQDLSLESGRITLKNREDFQLKTRKGRVVPLNQVSIAVLNSLPRSSEFVFPGHHVRPFTTGWVSRRFKWYVRKAGLSEEIHFHCLRHTGATWLVSQNVPLSYIQDILGHSSITTTMIYAHSSPEYLRQSVESLDQAFRPHWLN